MAGVSSEVPSAQFTLSVNGQAHLLEVDVRTTLLDALREQLRLSGRKKSCGHGQCGACTVLINRRRINSCVTLAVMHEGDAVITIEGLGSPNALHPLQAIQHHWRARARQFPITLDKLLPYLRERQGDVA